MKPLKEILKEVEILEVYPKDESWLNQPVYGVSDNSKEVSEGYVFIARKGTSFRGEDFIDEAVERGAKVIVRETPVETEKKLQGVYQIRVKDVKKALSQIVLNFFDHPEKKLTLIGVTGTNGKTSVCYFTKTLLQTLGIKTGYVGTIFYEIERRIPATETTPSLIRLAGLMKEMVEKGFKACVMEVSSHALDQGRITGLKFEVAGFTNLSRDHLDYHKTMEDYYQAKKKLFTEYLAPEGKAVLSFETESGKRLYQELKDFLSEDRILVVNNGTLRVEILGLEEGLEVELKFLNTGEAYRVKTSLFGEYQAKNLATVVGILMALGYSKEEICSRLETLKNPVGRLELVAEFRGAKIFVDYAHTPSALEHVLKSLLPLKKNRLIVVFGCGGNRDPGKRPLMGEVAENLSDYLIITSDNPRFEDPERIIQDIKQGLKGVKPCKVIPDRKEAIEAAINLLEKGDILVIAGKGHETYQEIQGKRYPFSDQDEVLETIKRLNKEYLK
ncbi:UDP-N-acetylmuramoyl-L-alanyl-D-glutamate--2,6-diaminopimelate ligase [Thermodesulfobacterium sp. TA1]|uniref:UDP-N-acetylmuramoyl-L-alanyl-D-glutamate--2, 6-diaminopimelate ligase n=1 Tax=Thermodesulfobacterium sp. TA1 TaxID=2234087 RepID=UPI00123222C1|nr:UDP-N-acetylmuramoyl-L-alanyl-D-glutamate--2,6-diaminopimelate ligase [Thermodesulfobacterium sp. TA1]QER41661.1 UDP-N-acetylmuramoyl-L-alanyl-D-glutamate--2,6-diaminopimelate ligase [Thermodesulfobacterium sp. TA1]